jgi:hypothetical protein
MDSLANSCGEGLLVFIMLLERCIYSEIVFLKEATPYNRGCIRREQQLYRGPVEKVAFHIGRVVRAYIVKLYNCAMGFLLTC